MKLFKCAFLGIVAILLCGCGESGGEFDAINVGKMNVVYENGILKIAESNALNSSLGASCGDLADFGHCADSSLALRPKSAKNSTTSTANTRICDLDSVNQAQNAESTLDSAESQNLVKNNPRASANLESRPLRGAKNRIQASSSASADFLLEAEKRGSPPKSEKAAAFWETHLNVVGGSGNRGVQPFLREKTSEISGNGIAESKQESQGGLPRRFCESARNDEFLDSSPTAQNDKNSTRVAESTLDSAIPKHEANSSIADEFLGLCEASDDDRTLSPSRKRADALPEKSLRDAEFADSAQKDFILFFFTSTCGVCKAQLPILEQLRAQGIKIYAILGDVPNISKASAFVRAHKISLPLFYESGARRFFTSAVGGVKGVPVMVVFKDGKIKEKFIGLTPKGTLLRAI